MKTIKITLLIIIIFCIPEIMHSQEIALKTNTLYWASWGTANIEGEVVVGERSSLNLMVGYNPWTFSNNKKLKHISVMPGYRYWTCSPMNGQFLGVQLEYAHFNVGNIEFPFSIWKDLRNERFQGDMGAIGVSYGYHHIFSPRWSIEFEFGIGLAYAAYDRYLCENCGTKLGTESKFFVKPTRAAISLVYIIK